MFPAFPGGRTTITADFQTLVAAFGVCIFPRLGVNHVLTSRQPLINFYRRCLVPAESAVTVTLTLIRGEKNKIILYNNNNKSRLPNNNNKVSLIPYW